MESAKIPKFQSYEELTSECLSHIFNQEINPKNLMKPIRSQIFISNFSKNIFQENKKNIEENWKKWKNVFPKIVPDFCALIHFKVHKHRDFAHKVCTKCALFVHFLCIFSALFYFLCTQSALVPSLRPTDISLGCENF